MPKGWIKLHRKILDSEMYKALNSKQRDVMVQCLLLANHSQNEWRHGKKLYRCKPGQFITSLASLRKKCGKDVSIQNIRTALLILETWQFLTTKSTATGRIITIKNWHTYQTLEPDDQQTNQQAANKALTTNKNDKECKEEKTARARVKLKTDPRLTGWPGG